MISTKYGDFVAPGGGAPPHIHHREDESFHLLEGTLTIQVGGDTIVASAGDFVYLPRGTAHSFKNAGDANAKALVLATPAGLEGFFADVFEPATDRSVPLPSHNQELIGRALSAGPPGTGSSFFLRHNGVILESMKQPSVPSRLILHNPGGAHIAPFTMCAMLALRIDGKLRHVCATPS